MFPPSPPAPNPVPVKESGPGWAASGRRDPPEAAVAVSGSPVGWEMWVVTALGRISPLDKAGVTWGVITGCSEAMLKNLCLLPSLKSLHEQVRLWGKPPLGL